MLAPYLLLHFLPHRILPSFWKIFVGTAITSVSSLVFIGHQFSSHERVTETVIQAPSASRIILAKEPWGLLELEKGTALYVRLMNMVLSCPLQPTWMGGWGKEASVKQWTSPSVEMNLAKEVLMRTLLLSFAVGGFSHYGILFVSYKKVLFL